MQRLASEWETTMRSDGVGSRRQININHRAASSARFTISSAHRTRPDGGRVLFFTARQNGSVRLFCAPVSPKWSDLLQLKTPTASTVPLSPRCSYYLAIQRSVCLFVCLFFCTVEDISTQDGAIGVKFWLRVEQTPGTGTRLFGGWRPPAGGKRGK